MSQCRLLAVILLTFTALPLLAQTSATPESQAPTPRARMGGCWQQAGVPPDAAREGREIERKTHAQVMAVCNDPSLNDQQKREQIHQLRAQALEQVKALVTQEQAQEYKSCMAERNRGRGGLGEWPCGAAPRGTPGTPPPSNEASPPGSTENQER